MDWLEFVLLESPAYLLGGLMLLLAALGSCWFFRPGRVTGWLVVGGLLLGTVLLIVQHIVVTDRERIDQLLEELALAVDCEDLDKLADALTDDARIDQMDKQQLLVRLEDFFDKAEIDDVKILDRDIQTEDNTASVVLQAHCRVRGTDWPYEHHASAWEVKFVRRSGRWLIHHVRHTAQKGVTAGDLLNLAIQ